MSSIKSSPKKPRVRLSPHINPEKYSITLQPNLDAFTFTGQEDITLRIGKATQEITLHASELTIAKASFIHKERVVESKKIVFDKKVEMVTITFKKPLPKGT